ncbi:hypothetical protein RJZ56_003158 [Blastomyces dermatitidis]|uniref:Uncharacterized protein n=1 Tax=Blastomyces gilchristii (strain SLH14081) TaxID=559298 RepID=A0A179V1N7_BLAGS|nr:uncharacterized protein BDBG_09321 [Blastomyces gilchristii SLH14081]OAT14256.1 hypothetical protein BDBG_09321 [Blastomyces gilchristii SLH14081]
MEVIQEYVIPALQNANKYIPPSISLQALSYYSTFTTHFLPISQQYLQPYFLTPLQTLLNSPPDLTSLLVLCLLLFISLRVLDYARRIITFWVMLVFRLAFWGSVIGGAYYVYVVGWERAGREAGWLLGLLQGFVEEMWANSLEAQRQGQGQTPPIYGGMRWEQARKRTG